MRCTRRSLVQWFPFDYYRNNHSGTLPVCTRHTKASMPIVLAARGPIQLSGVFCFVLRTRHLTFLECKRMLSIVVSLLLPTFLYPRQAGLCA